MKNYNFKFSKKQIRDIIHDLEDDMCEIKAYLYTDNDIECLDTQEIKWYYKKFRKKYDLLRTIMKQVEENKISLPYLHGIQEYWRTELLCVCGELTARESDYLV